MSFLSRLFLRGLLFPGCALLAPAQSTYSTPYTFGTFAGTSSLGSADGSGTAARFYGVAGLAVDAAGNVFVADTSNHTIRKISPVGDVTTFAGQAGLRGTTDGTGTAARFNQPYGLVIDATSNLFVADMRNQTIRKITPAGVVTTLAGLPGTTGSADGSGSDARFYDPADLAIDATGNLFVGDSANYTVRKVTPAGLVTTVAGTARASDHVDGIGSAARFNQPFGLAVDATGNVFLFDRGVSPTRSHMIYLLRKITPAGEVSTLKQYPVQVGPVMDIVQGQIFDATGNRIETQGGEIRRVAPDGTITAIAGKAQRGYADGPGATATFGSPGQVAFDGQGNLYIADRGNNNVRKITAAGEVSTLAGLAGPATLGSTDATGTAARFGIAAGVAVSASGDVFVADHDNYIIRKITPAGVVTTLAGAAGQSGTTDGTGNAARFLSPAGIAVDAANNVYVGEVNGALRKITSAGVVTTLAQFSSPQGVAVDPAGQIWVADTYEHTINRISPNGGAITVVAGTTNSFGRGDGQGRAAQFQYPRGLAIDGAGNVYVADTNNHSIRKISPSGTVSTLAGNPAYGTADGTGANAQFEYPNYLTVDAAGNIYVADSWNEVIRKITPAGSVSTVAGLADARGSADGTGSDARFYLPQGIAVNTAGELYVASLSTIRKGVAAGRPVITTQPQSLSVQAGNNAQFSVIAAADPAPAYQWYLNGSLLSGATAATLNLNNIQSANAGSYTVVVANSLGTVTSAAATLTVTAAPIMPTPPTTPTNPTPPANPGSGGGGGGAPSVWFSGALLALGAARWLATPASRRLRITSFTGRRCLRHAPRKVCHLLYDKGAGLAAAAVRRAVVGLRRSRQ